MTPLANGLPKPANQTAIPIDAAAAGPLFAPPCPHFPQDPARRGNMVVDDARTPPECPVHPPHAAQWPHSPDVALRE